MQFITAIRWPAPAGGVAKPAQAIKACESSLPFAKAKPVKADGAVMLLALLAGAVADKDATSVPPGAAPSGDAEPPSEPLCRDGAARTDYGVYRSETDRDRYMLALYDSGRIVEVSPALIASTGRNKSFSVTLADVDGTVSTFDSFRPLPDPEQVWALVRTGKPTGRSQGNQVTLAPKD